MASRAGARRFKRVVAIDLEHCPNCSGDLKIVAAVLDAPTIERIRHLIGMEVLARPQRFA